MADHGGGARLRTLLCLGVAAFVAVDVAVDRRLGGAVGTYHHSKSLTTLAAGLVLAVPLWRSRGQFPAAGRAGLLLCAAGGLANGVNIVADPRGVADYLHVRFGTTLIVFNAADVALVGGLLVVAASTAVVYGRRIRGLLAAAPAETRSG